LLLWTRKLLWELKFHCDDSTHSWIKLYGTRTDFQKKKQDGKYSAFAGIEYFNCLLAFVEGLAAPLNSSGTPQGLRYGSQL